MRHTKTSPQESAAAGKSIKPQTQPATDAEVRLVRVGDQFISDHGLLVFTVQQVMPRTIGHNASVYATTGTGGRWFNEGYVINQIRKAQESAKKATGELMA